MERDTNKKEAIKRWKQAPNLNETKEEWVAAVLVVAMEERGSRTRMSGMPEWEQTLRMRNQRQLNNLQDKT